MNDGITNGHEAENGVTEEPAVATPTDVSAFAIPDIADWARRGPRQDDPDLRHHATATANKPGRHPQRAGKRWRSCVNYVAAWRGHHGSRLPCRQPWRPSAVKRIAETVGRTPRVDKNGQTVAPPIIAGLARANRNDITKAWEAVAPAVRPRIRLHRHLRHPHGAQAAHEPRRSAGDGGRNGGIRPQPM
ncbi:MAG: hypothetical protein R2873_26590 [Caldilineaceae bacterium]